MSQLDFAITYSHFAGFVVCFYIFCHYMGALLLQFWANQKLRACAITPEQAATVHTDATVLVKRILTV